MSSHPSQSMPPAPPVEERTLSHERWELLRELDEWLEVPMVLLGLLWLVLLVVELLWGVTPLLQLVSNVIWGIFIFDFLVKLLLAPARLPFLRRNWLTLISLALPALRIVRLVPALRALSAARGVRLVRMLTSLNRGMRSLRVAMGRRGIGYVVALTALVTGTGAAGMAAFERGAGSGIDGFGAALWWTAMLMTTLGSENWPVTPEGRLLGFLLALYAVTVFGYLTASLASYFIGRDQVAAMAADAPHSSEVSALRDEIAGLRSELRSLRR